MYNISYISDVLRNNIPAIPEGISGDAYKAYIVSLIKLVTYELQLYNLISIEATDRLVYFVVEYPLDRKNINDFINDICKL